MQTLAFILALQITEPPRSGEGEHKQEITFLANLRESFTHFSLKSDAAYFLWYGTLILVPFWIAGTLWQPYLLKAGLPVAAFGVVMAVASLLEGITAKYAHVLEGKIGMRISLMLVPLVLAATLFLQSFFIVLFGLVFRIVQRMTNAYVGPLLLDYVNTRIPSSIRATILSTHSMMISLLFIIFSPLVGLLIDHTSLQYGFFSLGLSAVIFTLVFSVWKRNIDGLKVARG